MTSSELAARIASLRATLDELEALCAPEPRKVRAPALPAKTRRWAQWVVSGHGWPADANTKPPVAP